MLCLWYRRNRRYVVRTSTIELEALVPLVPNPEPTDTLLLVPP